MAPQADRGGIVSLVTTKIEGPVGLITINRPEALNMFDLPLIDALQRGLANFEQDPDARVIVVTGAGERAFAAGADIADLNARRSLAHYLEFADVVHRAFRRFEACEKPTISAINGLAVGGGLELVLATDIRIAAEQAKLGLPEIALGLFPGGGGSQRLMRQISPCRAREMMFTGDSISAASALELGLVNRVVSRERVLPEAMELALRIAGKSLLALKLLKRTLNHGADMPLPAALAYEQAMVSLAFDSSDAHEGCDAFLAKRTPTFRDR
ncbi:MULTISPECIES: enoyl-CoA hydratase/isomerase family protein [unclassified Bradyrhizobium]|uniref:enoyl-CoA hydratase/isomerase family protein n=1 Tax=unclassified Bradyrhizobium TaxID=2631580 RepID=UPI002111FFC5|nr:MULTISPECIES: enoyl-CoA hydratase/isomerase family protein [unclassified Bradyrhizobium]